MQWPEARRRIAKVVTGGISDSVTRPYVVAQANLQRKALATNELMLEANKRNMAFALLQEPYIGGIGKMKDYRGARIYQCDRTEDGAVKTAIAVFDGDIDVVQCPDFTTPNITVVKMRTIAWEIAVVSFYFEPKPEPIGPYLEQLKKIERNFGRRIIMGGDVNAQNSWWGSNKANERGREAAGALDEMDLQVLNVGSTPTFHTVRGTRLYTSIVDITVCTTELLGLVDDWKVVEGLTSSDHNTITFKLALEKARGIQISRTTRIFNSRKADWDQFREKLAQLLTEQKINPSDIEKIKNETELEHKIKTFQNSIIEAANTSIPLIKPNNRVNLPWWSEELATLKRAVATKRRRIRCAAPVRRAAVVAEYLQIKNEYETKARNAQTESWKAFCERQDGEGLWDGIYRVISRTKKRHEDLPLTVNGKVLDNLHSAELLAETFYPGDRRDEDSEEHKRVRMLAEKVNVMGHGEKHDPPFTIEELNSSIRTFNPKKAPGADGLTADICQRSIDHDPGNFLALANKCLELGYFPGTWKEATVVILRKPGKKSYTAPKSYRPIGLLPVLGKVLEKMVINRVKWHIIPKLSTRQYGFMPQKSTEDSLYDLVGHIRSKLAERKLIVMVSLDIEGAFDSAWWPAIRTRLAEEKCPVNVRRIIDSYLNNRRVRVRYAGEEVVRETSKGCVQGSIGGPILWNTLLDPLLKGLEERGDYCQAFADDVVLVFDGDSAIEIERKANDALAHVYQWGVSSKLKFAPHKTNAMVITRKLKYDTPRLSMGGVAIGMTQEIKILGLTIDNKLTFNKHVVNVCQKAIGFYKQLSRAAKVSWGLHPDVIRTMYTAVVEPIIMYAASAWAPAVTKLCVTKRLNAVQRGFAQKSCKSYRTVSLNSALVLAGILPLDLRIREAAALYEARRGLPRLELGDRDVERRTAFASTPHPAEHMSLQFICLADQEQLAHHCTQAVQIYTDGSKIDGKVGAALSLWSNGVETKCQKMKLSSHCTVYQAELLAICKATREIQKHNAGSFGIFSDSRSSLETVANHRSSHPLAVETRENLRKCSIQNKRVSLFWIKAHAGLEGNERADHLAKEAALYLKKRPDYDQCPVSFVKRQIRKDSLVEWNLRYRMGETAATTKLFFPDAVDAYKIVRKIRPTGIITQVMTGHGGFSEYLNRFKCKESPSCVCDPDKDETAIHVLTDCPVYGPDRYELEQKIGTDITTENLNKLIADKKHSTAFIEFCVKTAQRTIERNKN